ncbi:MAG TPA: hypothetical protein P5250_00110 [Bacteroidales bacterium]|nr:hypothetical protein [Bacteroidales bacterium]
MLKIQQKKNKLLYFIILLIFLLYACKNYSKKASDYYQNIYKCIYPVLKSEDTLIGAITIARELQAQNNQITDTSHIEKINCLYLSLKKNIDSMLAKLNNMPVFDNNESLKNSAIQLLKAYQQNLTNYEALINIIKISTYDYKIEDDISFYKITNTINSELEKEIELFNKISEKFANNYKINITEH